ncbi:hypothetical protein [Nocardioides daeguensis]|uniref:Uncharacterized protein n=1 Tax=Nocardioides daeguensis TaxID=908359 RepID=A0ABP6WJI0_9ACTN|nr:hypothetical protein [Nocardioides daeguensis]MBV6729090.1 hypothetical protein [Nocardioides daeguensis]MCR1774906.1 hypothetical protein [Nocardioides daeguensis]
MSTRVYLLKNLAAGLVVLGIIAGVIALGRWISGPDEPDDSPAPATKKAIAAVAVDALDLHPTSFNVNPRYDVPEPLGVEIRFRPPGDKGDAHYLHVEVGPAGSDAEDGCSEYDDCADWDGHDGHFHLSWQEEQPEEDPGILTLTFRTAAGEERSVTYAGEQITGDPRDQDLPLGVEDDLVRLLTDDRFSATTTQAMLDADLPKWPDDDTLGDPVPTTPEVVAQWMVEDGARDVPTKQPADTTAYGDGAVGAELVSDDHTTTVVLVPQDSPSVPTCGAAWHCETRRGVVRGWQPGVAIAIRRTQDAVALVSVRAPVIDGAPRMRSRLGTTGEDYRALADGFAAFTLRTTEEFAAGVPAW